MLFTVILAIVALNSQNGRVDPVNYYSGPNAYMECISDAHQANEETATDRVKPEIIAKGVEFVCLGIARDPKLNNT